MDDREARAAAARVEGLLGEVEAIADPAARETALAAVQALVELYGEALARVTARAGPESLISDELLSHLLIAHDLHPLPVGERVAAALNEVRPYLESHGGGVDLLGVEDGVARIRLRGSCEGCPSSAMTLKLAVEDAVRRAAPEIERVDAEDAASPVLQIEIAEGLPIWRTLAVPTELEPGRVLVTEVAGEELLLLKVERELYAYRPGCPACGASLDEAALRGAELRCASCGKTYDVRRAGRCLDSPQLHLEPVPLLEDGAAAVKVAVPA
jgi:Fe-S cluster biogenesis protein NfuA/nitrite reductase/ring-hydroxylating ferredoxin subunit